MTVDFGVNASLHRILRPPRLPTCPLRSLPPCLLCGHDRRRTFRVAHELLKLRRLASPSFCISSRLRMLIRSGPWHMAHVVVRVVFGGEPTSLYVASPPGKSGRGCRRSSLVPGLSSFRCPHRPSRSSHNTTYPARERQNEAQGNSMRLMYGRRFTTPCRLIAADVGCRAGIGVLVNVLIGVSVGTRTSS